MLRKIIFNKVIIFYKKYKLCKLHLVVHAYPPYSLVFFIIKDGKINSINDNNSKNISKS